jgi:hypothetical protein
LPVGGERQDFAVRGRVCRKHATRDWAFLGKHNFFFLATTYDWAFVGARLLPSRAKQKKTLFGQPPFY